MNRKKRVSLLVVLAMLIAYAIPFNIAALADGEIIWTFENAPAGTSLANISGKTKEWYVSDADLGNGLTAYSNGTINEEKWEYSNAFEVDRTSATDFTIDDGTEQVVGALKFGGKSSANTRYLTYTPSSAGKITAYVKHGSPSGTDTRTLTITQGSNAYDISVTAPDTIYVVGNTDVAANSEIKITVNGNVALAKLVFTPDSGGTSDPTNSPEATEAPEASSAPEVTEAPEASSAPEVTEAPEA
ncbi:MAG: hypothetical protein ACI4C7_04840, partial [Clostridia bacterium]